MSDVNPDRTPLGENAPSALEATQRYTGEGWRDINGSLRSGIGDISDEDSGVVETLDRLVDSSPVSQDHTVYRGVRASSVVGEAVDDDDVSEALGNLIGETISDGGFVSTSIKPGSATGFANKRKKGEGPSDSPPVVMRINVPEGTGAYYVNSRYNEKEVILGRDTELRITGVTELQNLRASNGQSSYILDVEVVPREEARLAPDLKPDAPEYSDYGPFVDGQDYLNQYRDAPEADRPALMQASSNQDTAYVAARQEYRAAQQIAEAEANPIELPEPRDTPQRPSMTSTASDLEVKGSPVKNGAKVEGLEGSTTLDLSKHGIDQRVNSLTTQIGEDFGIEVDEVVYALNMDEWHALDGTEANPGALAFYEDGKIFISPYIARKLGSNNPEEYFDGIRVLSHEMGHGASGAEKNGLINSGLRPVTEEAGAEISALYYAKRRFDAELLDATERHMTGVDGPITYNGVKAVYLDAGYPERVEEMILQSVRRNGWNREAALNDIMYTFTEGDSMDFVYDDEGKVTRIFPQNIGGRGAQIDPVAAVRWGQIWGQAPVDIREPYRDVDPSAVYAADRPVIGETHLTEAEWVDRQVRVASLLHWLFEDDGTDLPDSVTGRNVAATTGRADVDAGAPEPKLAPAPAAIPTHRDIEWKPLNRQQPGNAVIAEQLIPQGSGEIGGSDIQKREAKQQSVEGIVGRLTDNEDVQKWATAAGPYSTFGQLVEEVNRGKGRYGDDDVRNWIDQQINAWAEMDGPKVDEINAAIGRVFDIPGYNLFDEDDEIGKGAAYDAFVTAMYEETQAFLADGPDEYVFFRGLLGQNYSGELNDGIDAWQDRLDTEWGGQLGDFPGYVYTDAILEGRPGASWSAAYPTAKEFAQGGVVLTVTVPKESILSTPQSGMGALFEDEVVLLDHGSNPVTVLTASQTEMSARLSEEIYRSLAGSGDFDLSGNVPFPVASNRAGQKRTWSNAILDSFNNRGVWVDLDTPPDEADPEDIANIIERFRQ